MSPASPMRGPRREIALANQKSEVSNKGGVMLWDNSDGKGESSSACKQSFFFLFFFFLNGDQLSRYRDARCGDWGALCESVASGPQVALLPLANLSPDLA